MTMKKSMVGALVAVMVLLATTAAASGASSTRGGGEKAHATLTIPTILDLTGSAAFAGVPTAQGMTVAFHLINSEGGVDGFKLGFKLQDSQSDVNQAVQMFSAAAGNSNNLVIVGPTSSRVAPGVAPIATTDKIAMVSPTASTTLFTAGSPWAFKIALDPTLDMTVIADAAIKLGVKKPALIYDGDNPGQVQYVTALKTLFGNAGISLVASSAVISTDTNFSSVLTQIASKNPDALFVLTTTPQNDNIIIQAKQAGMTSVQYYGATAASGADFVKAGASAVEGVIAPAEYLTTSNTKQNKIFAAAYKAKYGTPPDPYSAEGYATVQLIAQAMRKLGPKPTRAKLRNALASLRTVSTVMGSGTLTMGSDRNPQYTSVLVQVKNGVTSAVVVKGGKLVPAG
jgi:branched-chain amino acid transport system substrate-binding protein